MAPLELCLLPPHAAPLPRGCPLLGFAAALVLLLTCLLPTAPPVAWALQTHVRLRPPPRPLPRAAAVHGRLQPPPPRVPPRPALRPLRWPPTPLLPGPRRAPGAATAAARASGPGPALVLAPLLALVSALLYYARSPHNTWAVLPVAAAEVRSTALLDLRLPAAPAPAPARVLICGDADFAYSRALAARLRHRAQIWTSCFEAEEALLQRYPHAGAAMAALRGARVDVRCGVDARALSSHYGAAARFDRIVFNLPQVCACAARTRRGAPPLRSAVRCVWVGDRGVLRASALCALGSCLPLPPPQRPSHPVAPTRHKPELASGPLRKPLSFVAATLRPCQGGWGTPREAALKRRAP